MEWSGPLRSDDDRRRQFEPRKRLAYVLLFCLEVSCCAGRWDFLSSR
jgi:hypothetical protein